MAGERTSASKQAWPVVSRPWNHLKVLLNSIDGAAAGTLMLEIGRSKQSRRSSDRATVKNILDTVDTLCNMRGDSFLSETEILQTID
eukprot:scaffold522270_cov46-Prasinocladus_malaysianus.AAC.1